MTDLREQLGVPTPEEIKEKMRLEQINNLEEYNAAKQRGIDFNNIKLMILRRNSVKVISEYIDKHFKQYQDEEEIELLLTFLNKHK